MAGYPKYYRANEAERLKAAGYRGKELEKMIKMSNSLDGFD